MVDISALYPQPNQNQNQSALSGNPLQNAALMLQIQQGQLGLQNLRAQQAAGAAFQSAINPDGTFNPNAALQGIRNNPNAAFAAPGAVSTGLAQQGSILDNRQKQIGIANSQLQLGVNNNAAAASILAPYASQPSMSDEDVYNAKAKLAAAGVDPATVAASDIRTPVKALRAARVGAVQGMGPGAAAAPVAGAPDPGTGAPTNVPLGATVGAGPRSVGFGPTQAADQAEYLADQTRSAALVAGLRPLQTALPLIEKLNDVTNFGPGSQQFTKLKAALVNTGVIAPGTTDAAVRQEAGKYLLQSVTQSAGAGRSDEGLSAALGSNPNADTMLKPAVIATVKNKIAMDRQDAALPAYAASISPSDKNPALGYKNLKTGYYPTTDVRAFRFDLMSPQERRETIDSLGSPDSAPYKNFMNSLDIAKSTHLIHTQAGLNSILGGIQTPPAGQQ